MRKLVLTSGAVLALLLGTAGVATAQGDQHCESPVTVACVQQLVGIDPSFVFPAG